LSFIFFMTQKSPRRNFLTKSVLSLAALFTAPAALLSKATQPTKTDMQPIISIKPLGFQWETADPFLFCVHHEDYFPQGNDAMGPDPTHFNGRHLGDDFIIKDGFRMYHGKTVPGFPGHPHRGFETITVVRKGLVDHADSLGAAGRYGDGDVQWMTAGKGVQHSEMFPLLKKDTANTLELFQIWLNLPKKNKMVNPHFKMLWREAIPNFITKNAAGKQTKVEIIAGKINELLAPAAPPDSWAADPNNEVAVWNIKMDAGATWTLPQASEGINRTIYFYEGENLNISGTVVPKYVAITLHANAATALTATTETSILMLQGKPINEPVMQYGPFVMNTKEEINQAFEDYHATQFGGWPWSRYDQVHDRNRSRFAKHSDGREEVQQG
jgi:quercetin 2,3-dioxygenase